MLRGKSNSLPVHNKYCIMKNMGVHYAFLNPALTEANK